MNKYTDLEISILSCILQKPELMEDVKLEDKHFIKHKKIWMFMKAFYKKFKTFDLTLMVSISSYKYRMIEYIIWLLEKEPSPSLYKQYEQQLIELYEEEKKDKWIIEKVYELSNELYVRNINTSEFKNKLNEIYENANKLFKNEEVKKNE